MQFSFAAVLLIVVAFGIMQMAMMNAAAIMLSSELSLIHIYATACAAPTGLRAACFPCPR